MNINVGIIFQPIQIRYEMVMSKAIKMKQPIVLNREMLLGIIFMVISLGPGCQTDNGSDDPINPVSRYDLRIQRHSNTDLSSTQADSILNDMNTVIQTSDGPDDVLCPVSMFRDGEVTPFQVGSGIINSEADFEAVNGLSGNIKVVNQINWCSEIAPNIIGCAPVPGESLIVVRFDPNQEGILWLHEFGHNRGLLHRNDRFAVMNETIDTVRRAVNKEECDMYMGLSGQSTAFHGLMSGKRQTAIEEFVRQTYIHGVPYEEASRYGKKVVPILLSMLKDPKEEKYWANIVVTLGIIGEKRALGPLIDFIEQDVEGTLSPSHYSAKTSALMALGYFVNKTKNNRALFYLNECSHPTFWNEMGTHWSSPYHEQTSERNFQLSTVAILGLALCGTKEATDALRIIQIRQPANAEEEKFQKQIVGTVRESIATCEIIAKEGLLGYYNKSKKR